jgi:hypothetical protein
MVQSWRSFVNLGSKFAPWKEKSQEQLLENPLKAGVSNRLRRILRKGPIKAREVDTGGETGGTMNPGMVIKHMQAEIFDPELEMGDKREVRATWEERYKEGERGRK